VLALGIGGNYYLTKKENPNNPQQNNPQNQNPANPDTQQGAITDPLVPSTQAEKDLRAQILVIVGKSNAGQKQEALTEYLALEKTNPTDLMLLNNIASTYSDLSNWAKSVEYYKKVIAAYPQYTPAYRMLGYIYWYHLGNNETQIKTLFDVGLQITNNNPDLASWMVGYYADQPDKAAPYAAIVAGAKK
ncbi:MAG: hypothetical protein PHR14_08095, partial [Oscillospiraceae bacterium]|nr:hypothetical protein [Oscillospiraceae bacterium]